MKPVIPLLALALLVAAPARVLRAQDVEKDKAQSGEKFLENGGQGSVGGAPDGAAVDASGGTGGADAMKLVNSQGGPQGLKTGNVPPPKKGDVLAKAAGAAKGAVYGAVGGAVIGGVVGSLGGPAGTLGGAAGGAKLGAIAGAAIGGFVGFLLAGKASEGKTGAVENRQNQLDQAMKDM